MSTLYTKSRGRGQNYALPSPDTHAHFSSPPKKIIVLILESIMLCPFDYREWRGSGQKSGRERQVVRSGGMSTLYTKSRGRGQNYALPSPDTHAHFVLPKCKENQ
jgi:hypothetical protein